MSELMKKASMEAHVKDIRKKCIRLVTFLTKNKVSTHKAIKRVLPQPMRHSNVDVLYVPMGLKTRTKILKSLSILEIMHSEDTNVFVSNIIDKYEN